jgi:hypothetical protein
MLDADVSLTVLLNSSKQTRSSLLMAFLTSHADGMQEQYESHNPYHYNGQLFYTSNASDQAAIIVGEQRGESRILAFDTAWQNGREKTS